MSTDPLIGLKLGDYVVEGVIAAGGMGIVYRARHPLLGRSVAVKVLRARYARDTQQVERFLKEAQVLSAMHHDGIVDVFNFGHLPDGRQYMMMELLAGETLDDLLKREGALPVPRALALVDQVLEALSAAHRVGVVHRDLKPSNIFLARQAQGAPRVKLLDFGLAQQLAPDEDFDPKRKASIVGGTPQYMSPEQVEGLVATPQSDLYAVGGVLFLMVSGRPAFVGDEWGYLLRAQVTIPAPSLASVLPGVSADLSAVVAQLLEKQSARRPASAELVRKDLARVLRQLPAASAGAEAQAVTALNPATEPGPAAARPMAAGRAPRLALVFGGLALAGAAAAFVALQAASEPELPSRPAPAAVVTLDPRPNPRPVAPPAPAPAAPAMDEAAFKAAMAAAEVHERQMAAEHRDRDLVMGVKKLTEQGLPAGHEVELAEQILKPALSAEIENQRVVDARAKSDTPGVAADDERLSVLRASCKQPGWKRGSSARLDRELSVRLVAIAEAGLPTAAERMKTLKEEANRLGKIIDRARTVDQCVEALSQLDHWVALNVAH